MKSEIDPSGINLPIPFTGEVPSQNNTFLVGTTGSQNLKSTANSTAHAGKSKTIHNCILFPELGLLGGLQYLTGERTDLGLAHAIWHFAQTWFEEFPFYKPNDEKISIWTESYGGKYGPAFTSFFEEQNDKIANGTITTPGAHRIHIDTLGIINGCSDFRESSLAWGEFAYNVSPISVLELIRMRGKPANIQSS